MATPAVETEADIEPQVLLFAAQIFFTVGVGWGLGKHIAFLTPKQVSKALMFNWIGEIIDIICMALGKFAIVAFLLQIRGPHDPSPWILWSVAYSSVITNVITISFIL